MKLLPKLNLLPRINLNQLTQKSFFKRNLKSLVSIPLTNSKLLRRKQKKLLRNLQKIRTLKRN
jgi:hypothetical protein